MLQTLMLNNLSLTGVAHMASLLPPSAGWQLQPPLTHHLLYLQAPCPIHGGIPMCSGS